MSQFIGLEFGDPQSEVGELLAKGAMSKTSSGKRRHRHYRDLHLANVLSAVAAWKDEAAG